MNNELILDFLKNLFPAPPALNSLPGELFSLNLTNILLNLPLDELWQAGNASLLNGNPELGKKCFKEYLKRDQGRNAKIISLLGVSNFLLGKKSIANKNFSEALLIDSSLVETRLWLNYLKLEEKKNKSVVQNLKLLKDLKNKRHKALALLFKVMSSLEDESSEEFLTESYNLYPLNCTADLILSIGFKKGKLFFDRSDYIAASGIWNSYYKSYGVEAWSRSKEIFNFFQKLSIQTSSKLPYEEMLVFVLNNNIFPEFYEEFDSLEERLAYFQKERKTIKIYPYADYRYAIILSYLGRYEESSELVYAARDSMPESKISYLKMDQLIQFLHERKFR